MPNPGDSGSCIGATQKYMKQRIEWKTPYLGHDIEGEYPTEAVLNNLIMKTRWRVWYSVWSCRIWTKSVR